MYNNIVSMPYNYKIIQLDEKNLKEMSYSDTNVDIHENEIKRFSNMYDKNIAEQFKNMQNNIMNKEIPTLTKLLMESSFEMGYESLAEKYFNQLSLNYGIIADTVLQNIYLQNMYSNQYLHQFTTFINEILVAQSVVLKHS